MSDMEWPRRCRRSCVYQKRDSKDNRMYCMARSEYGESMCLRKTMMGRSPSMCRDMALGMTSATAWVALDPAWTMAALMLAWDQWNLWLSLPPEQRLKIFRNQ